MSQNTTELRNRATIVIKTKSATKRKDAIGTLRVFEVPREAIEYEQ